MHICQILLSITLPAFAASPVTAQVSSSTLFNEPPDNLFNQDIVRIDKVIRVSNTERALRNQRREAILEKIDYILSIPENELDIWKVALTMAHDAYPDLDMKSLTEEFEAIVFRAKNMTPADASPDLRIRTLNTLLYRRLGIAYDKSDFMGEKLINRYAHGVVQTKKGTCANMAAFYIAVAQRLGYPIQAVAAPQHLFARYVDPKLEKQNIDPASQGAWSSDDDYIHDMEIPLKGIENGVYLRTMTRRELAAELIADHGAYYYAQVLKDYQTAGAILRRALEVSPRSAEFWRLLGAVHIDWAREDYDRDLRNAKKDIGHGFIDKAKEMGVGKPLAKDYWKHPPQKRKQLTPVSPIPPWDMKLTLKLQ